MEADERKSFCQFAEIPLQAVLPHLDSVAIRSLRLVSKTLRLEVDCHLTWLKPKYLRAGDIVRLWPELHKLDLANIVGPSDTDFQVLEKMTALHTLSVRARCATSVHDRTLNFHNISMNIFSNLTKLTCLSLAQAKGLVDEDFSVVGSLCNLKKLCLEGNCGIKGDRLFQTLSLCTQLADLDMESCCNMTLNGVLQISCLQPLTRLNLSWCHFYRMHWAQGADRSKWSSTSSTGSESQGPDSDLVFTINGIFSRHIGLKELCLGDSHLTDRSGVKWNLLTALTFLDISSFRGRSGYFNHATSLYNFWDVTQLQRLTFKGETESPCIAEIGKLTELTRLDFSLEHWGTLHVSYVSCSVPSRLTKLCHLKVDASYTMETYSSYEADHCDDDQVALIFSLTKLQYLYLKNLRVSEHGVQAMRNMRKWSSSLHTFRIPRARKVLETIGEELAAMTKLTHIDLSSCEITAEIANYLAALPDLRKLELNDCRGSKMSNILPFSQLTALHYLDVCYCGVKEEGFEGTSTLTNLTYLALAYNSITDAALLHLKNMRWLRVLHLENSFSITDEGLGALSGLSELETLYSKYSRGVSTRYWHLEDASTIFKDLESR